MRAERFGIGRNSSDNQVLNFFQQALFNHQVGPLIDAVVQRFARWFEWAEVIAGDFHYIGRHMPDRLPGRTVLTNTVTPKDVDDLRARGIATLITTTPNLGGRSFGTNLMEALIVAAAGRRAEDMTSADYDAWLDRAAFQPRVERLG